MENIRLGDKNASDAQVMEAARLAGCDEFISKLPEGYTVERCVERYQPCQAASVQRLSIARAFLKDAPIVILDEIAAALDVENEKKIQDSLNQLIAGKTVIIISHRPEVSGACE